MARARDLLAIIGAAFLGGLAVFALMAAAPKSRAKVPAVASVQELRIVGRDGRVQASLHSDEGGTAALSFYDLNNKPKLILTMNPDGTAAIVLGDVSTKDRASLMMLPGGTPSLSLETSDRGSILLGIPKGEKPNLEVYDANRRPLFQAVR